MVNINWYPGHMAKTKRLISEKIDMIDIVYEVVDARIPYSSKIKDIDRYIKNKPKILIMTKIDLCDMEKTNKWVKYYQTLGYHVIKVDLLNNKNIKELISLTKELLIPYYQKRAEKGLKERPMRILIIGIPNVGKSTLINRLVGKKATAVGKKPGITKNMSWIRINKELELLDTPGILWPKLEDEEQAFNLASMMAIKEEILPLYDVSVYILKKIHRYYPAYLKKRYDIDVIIIDDMISLFNLIGKKRGCIIKGGEIDYQKVASLIIKDLNEGRLGPVTFDVYDDKIK